jgi:hypothetical protein
MKSQTEEMMAHVFLRWTDASILSVNPNYLFETTLEELIQELFIFTN